MDRVVIAIFGWLSHQGWGLLAALTGVAVYFGGPLVAPLGGLREDQLVGVD